MVEKIQFIPPYSGKQNTQQIAKFVQSSMISKFEFKMHLWCPGICLHLGVFPNFIALRTYMSTKTIQHFLSNRIEPRQTLCDLSPKG